MPWTMARRPRSVAASLLRAKAVQVIIKKAARVFDQLREGRAAEFLDETVRVVRRGHRRHANGQAGGQQAVQRTDGGVLPGVVGIEAEHDFLHVALENARVVGGQGRALRRDDVLDAGHEAGDQVKLAFANDGPVRVQQRAFGFVQAKHDFALGENRGFRRVDVFGRFFVARQNRVR